jgi:3-hydroxyisobutyrate dehydrogenase-like beta-hydroxyacid dehydrogenase
MQSSLSLIGFGEAGSTFAQAGGWERSACAFDVADRKAAYDEAGVVPCASVADACRNAVQLISVVTADQALAVAQNAAQHIMSGTLYFDMNSVAPGTKNSAAQRIEEAGGRYVDVAVMAPVNPQRMAVPLLLSGPHAEAGRAALATLGFTNMRIVGALVGKASTIKMLRSVMYKGVEALTAECLIACEKAGVTDEVLASFGNDWSEQADYRIDRMLVHGLRRSAEMQESFKTLSAIGVSSKLTEATVGWQKTIGAMDIEPVPSGLKAKLQAILERMP